MTASGRLVAGRYRLVSRIGGGGMGAVWLGRDELLGREVAVKQVLPPAGADAAAEEQQRQRALREGRIAARLSHPHAISVYDVALEGGAPWLVMEYLPSRSLAEVVHDDGRLSVDQVAQVGAQVADALAATHAAGIVHRDVKPANILIGQGPRVEGLVKITDFGISHAAGDVTLTQTGQITGTPAFLAPEVAQGAEMSPESDVFSLGATLYTCLEGQPPFGMDDNPLRLLHRVAAGGPVPPRRAGSLTGPLTRMLDDDPARRPTMAQVRDELAVLAAGRDGDPTTVLLGRTSLRSSSNRQRTTELGTGATPAVDSGAPPTAVQDATSSPSAGPAEEPPAADRGAGRPPSRPVAAVPARPRRRRPWLVAALVLVLLLAGGGALWLTTRGDDDRGTTAAQGSTPAPSQADDSSAPESSAPEPAPTTSAAPTTTEPTATEATTEPTTAPGSEDDPVTVAEQTLGDYYALLPGDPDAAYAMTGPSLRGTAGRDYYRDFWSPWSEVELAGLRDVEEQDGAITAATEVRFTGTDGSRHVELHEVRFTQDDDGRWLVDLDRYVETIG
ncbi:serine/threonine-protein kinase [Geodermatophilus sabuli]|uniref:non-specific serine/threonine protein kinase n=1 Tax=Geodermatophilus sabuli TaxID=1564158 RepID=A0A285EC56_9ACTN|nr:serine/threonine-protein kinase [Geodermatophilus sabuli]MBB3083571.1 serine/threonine protein kinase [Geodermatophilus sabuli]SNX96708.1 Serine/threonine protein kinase [Geodermatophilus sabuli]